MMGNSSGRFPQPAAFSAGSICSALVRLRSQLFLVAFYGFLDMAVKVGLE